ncbi:deoxyribodipyrimidine photo-lyase [Mucilaginibacter sp. Bleaf8]|uniref:cryptochrome/photolyase family protein n=1 Tax=Mucilaginibacter sp. Bleaf8 TaxID=2834430 RepID=UPI001BCE8BB1|nr:deoxyribodipyrimidine photo-lyase [Mucilaginibacter sp. Bleaf8]MBS7564296.1 deoxyribodipyrimidine photo-lyase [Mucilaginibacter sp. Bleaf8]
MDNKTPVSIFWFRRDLRLHDNAGLYHALKGKYPVVCLFIFDRDILDKLEDRDDARVTFIYQYIQKLRDELQQAGSSLIVKYNRPEAAWDDILQTYSVAEVYTNRDYEPYAKQRDGAIGTKLQQQGIPFYTFKDQMIFERDEVVKDDGKPYTVFTPYKKRWLKKINDFYLSSYPTEKYLHKLYQTQPLPNVTLTEMGFTESDIPFPETEYQHIIDDYARDRDFPDKKGTSRIGIHLRFGTVSIRDAARAAISREQTWLGELIWREFYMMIFDHFPDTEKHAYRAAFDRIEWRNNEQEFDAWCQGKTGYPLVDAGMRELNATGFMHNRVRMVAASFMVKHLLIDWRWGEHYFARKLLDYEAATNIGSWQWVAGSGTDVMPYFRVFNPEAQLKKFDAKMQYIKKWVPEYGTSQYPKPIIDNKEGKARALQVYRAAVAKP